MRVCRHSAFVTAARMQRAARRVRCEHGTAACGSPRPASSAGRALRGLRRQMFSNVTVTASVTTSCSSLPQSLASLHAWRCHLRQRVRAASSKSLHGRDAYGYAAIQKPRARDWYRRPKCFPSRPREPAPHQSSRPTTVNHAPASAPSIGCNAAARAEFRLVVHSMQQDSQASSSDKNVLHSAITTTSRTWEMPARYVRRRTDARMPAI